MNEKEVESLVEKQGYSNSDTMIIFTSNIAHASIFNWFDDTKSQTEFLNFRLSN
ncbi:hypothetical protein EfmJHP35_28840 [Enterococcus faecium]|nr:hypothetical protein EfmJHP35_28840 [Enterococcus faecium]